MTDALTEKIKASLKDGRLPCAVAFKIAEDFKVPKIEVKEAAEKMGSKISMCQLECFP